MSDDQRNDNDNDQERRRTQRAIGTALWPVPALLIGAVAGAAVLTRAGLTPLAEALPPLAVCAALGYLAVLAAQHRRAV